MNVVYRGFPKVFPYLVKQPRREYDLEKIVNYEYVLQLEGLAVLHDLGTEDLDQVHVAQADH